MKTDLAHLWFNQISGKRLGLCKRDGNVFFEGTNIYSYGRHFCIARVDRDNKRVFFTTRTYTRSTATHKNYVLRSINKIDFKVIYCERPEKSYTESEIETLVKEQEQRDKEQRDKEQKRLERRERLDNLTPKQKEQRERERIKRDRRKQVKLSETLELWKNNQTFDYNKQFTRFLRSGYYLRLTKDGTLIETSQYANVPIADAKKLYQLLKQLPTDKATTILNGQTIGNYAINRITNEYVKIGCHVITWNEIEDLAKRLNW